MKKLINRLNQMYIRTVVSGAALLRDKTAEGYLDIAMKILITVVLGAAILAILNTAVPGLFTTMVNKISSEWNNVTILPN